MFKTLNGLDRYDKRNSERKVKVVKVIFCFRDKQVSYSEGIKLGLQNFMFILPVGSNAFVCITMHFSQVQDNYTY